MLDIFDLDNDVDLLQFMYDYENLVKSGVSLSRNIYITIDLMLLDFCRKNNIYILSGRVGKDKLRGDCTCQDVSLIHYFLHPQKFFYIFLILWLTIFALVFRCT